MTKTFFSHATTALTVASAYHLLDFVEHSDKMDLVAAAALAFGAFFSWLNTRI